ncbi:MAG: hypothetical protein PVJ89_11795 [Planctomycetota bacterium]|jgi:hypothetical protein
MVFRKRDRGGPRPGQGDGDQEPEVIEVEVERLDGAPDPGPRLGRRAARTLTPILLAMVIDAGDLATLPGTAALALPAGLAVGYLFSGYLAVATTWRVIIACVTGLYWALPFTNVLPLATAITALVEVLDPDRARSGSRGER